MNEPLIFLNGEPLDFGDTDTHYFTGPNCIGYCRRCHRNSLSCECESEDE